MGLIPGGSGGTRSVHRRRRRCYPPPHRFCSHSGVSCRAMRVGPMHSITSHRTRKRGEGILGNSWRDHGAGKSADKDSGGITRVDQIVSGAKSASTIGRSEDKRRSRERRVAGSPVVRDGWRRSNAWPLPQAQTGPQAPPGTAFSPFGNLRPRNACRSRALDRGSCIPRSFCSSDLFDLLPPISTPNPSRSGLPSGTARLLIRPEMWSSRPGFTTAVRDLVAP